MNLLELFFVISGIIIFFLALDIARKEKFNALHFFVFLMIGGGLLVFTFFPGVLNAIGRIFGIPRGADVLVYGSIIFLIYFVLLLLSKVERNRHDTTMMVREIALQNSPKYSYSAGSVFLLRVYNEAPVLQKVLENIYSEWFTNIVIVDDGSTDGSCEITEKFAKKHSHIIVLRHFQNKWAGAALETGFEYIRRYLDVEFIICFDSDGQHRIEDLKKFHNAFEKYPNLEVVFGSRFLSKKNFSNIPFMRKIILKLGRIFTRIMSGAKLTDAHNGYRVFRKSAIQKIRLTTDGMAYASELIEQIMRMNIPHGEIPVTILYSEYSLWKGQKSSNAIFIAFHTIWSKFFR